MFYNRYSHLDLDMYPIRIGNNPSAVRTVLDAGRCRHADWEQCEERRVQELEEVRLMVVQRWINRRPTIALVINQTVADLV